MDKRGYNYLIELKTLWEKEKLLIMSNFFFFHNVFKRCQMTMHQNEYLWSKGLTLSQTSPFFFTFLQYKSFENSVGKGEIAHKEQFLLSPQSFQKTFSTVYCTFFRELSTVLIKLKLSFANSLSFEESKVCCL